MSRDVTGRLDTVSPSSAASNVSLEAEHDPNISRRTSVAQLRQIQMKLGAEAATEGAHDAAARGVASPTTSLPFAQQIQSSFGPGHDVSGIQAHVGGDSASAMGASAYATGNHVVFDRAPDLHTAAHEAAHVVQQAQGVNLYGGVGDAGDSYERHADAVADRVVAGQSAADLLGRSSGMSTSTLVVQRKDSPKAAADKKKAEEAASNGPYLAWHMGLILRDDYRMLKSEPPNNPVYKAALVELAALKNGYRNSAAIPGRERREMFDRIDAVLGVMVPYEDADSELNTKQHYADLKDSVLRAEASDRVSNTLMTHKDGKDEAIEIPDDAHPKEQAELLKSEVPELLKTSGEMLDRAKALGEKVLGEEAKTVAQLDHAVQMLTVVNGFLKLNDADFMKEVRAGKIGSITELVKSVVEITGNTLQLTFELGSFLMKHVGEEAMADALGEASKTLGKGLTRVVAGFEVVHGLMTVFDSSKTREQRIDGGVEATMGLIVLGSGESLWALPVGGPYALVKIAAHLYRESVIGFETGALRELFSWMGEQGKFIASAGEALEAAGQLAAKEKDPARKAALQAEEKRRADVLASDVESFLARCTMGPDAHHGIGDGDVNMNLMHYPGNFGPVGEVFAPVMAMRGAKTGPAAAKAAAAILDGIRWCFQHADSLVRGSASKLNLAQIKEAEKKEQEEAAKKKKEEG
jgi:hypothetical protein